MCTKLCTLGTLPKCQYLFIPFLASVSVVFFLEAPSGRFLFTNVVTVLMRLFVSSFQTPVFVPASAP